MDIDELLNRYFEGETSSEEERELRAFLYFRECSGQVGGLYAYVCLFGGRDCRKERQPDEALIPIDEDILFMLDAEKRGRKRRRLLYDPWLYLVSGSRRQFACCSWGLTSLLNPVDPCFCSDNYVVINGRCYTDIHKVRSIGAGSFAGGGHTCGRVLSGSRIEMRPTV